MKARTRGALALVALLAGGSMVAEAQQGPMTFGPKAMFHFDSEDFGIGAFLTKPLTDAISIYPSFGYWFAGEGVTSWELNADLIYKVPGESLEWLYVGAGLNYWKSSVDGCPANIDCSFSDVGLNLIGGFQPVSAGRIKPFAEARLYIGDGSGFSVAGGLRIPLGN
ncbi:MAG: hypothetical protein KJZ47_02395 [Gemmatimonadales bacterium]|nr:hypothetical protein [Gemmatimonadales bacterium]